MSRIIKFGLAALAVAIGALTVSVAANGAGEVRAVEISLLGRNKVASITNVDLKSVTLEDYVIDGGKTDKKFRIPLTEGAYIDGAIIFNDCGRQYVGSSLGDAFGIHNNDENPNAYNFNVLFSFEHVYEMGIDVDVYSYNTLASEYCTAMVKFAHVDGDFYEALENASYADLVGLPGSSGFYANGAKDYNYGTFHLTESHTQKEVVWQPEASNLNVAAFQFTYRENNYIDNGNEITCTFNSLRFEYSCN